MCCLYVPSVALHWVLPHVWSSLISMARLTMTSPHMIQSPHMKQPHMTQSPHLTQPHKGIFFRGSRIHTGMWVNRLLCGFRQS